MADQISSYTTLTEELIAVFEGERDLIANMANCASLLFHTLTDINWVGFYRAIGDDLVLGPFHGRPACVRIGPGRGVCGAAAASQTTVIVPDVHQFPGHIACDVASQSEIVVPLLSNGRLIGVLDVDSPRVARFDEQDGSGLEAIVATLLKASDV